MYKKLVLSIAVLGSLIFSFSGCSYKTYLDAESYSQIWEKTGFHPISYNLYETSALFPESIDDLKVEKFHARYDEHLPLGEGFQILLSIKYEDKSTFEVECNRIELISTEISQQFDISNFEFSAYATIICWEDCFEYAIINTDEQVIFYIFLQDVRKHDIEFDHVFLPKNYPELKDAYINMYN